MAVNAPSSMNFRFSNLLGAAYRGGNLLIHDNELLSPVGNRVGQVRRGDAGELPATPMPAAARGRHWRRPPAGPIADQPGALDQPHAAVREP